MIGRIEELVNDGKTDEVFLFPHNDQSMVNVLYKNAVILDTEYLAEGVRFKATVDAKVKGMLSKYLVK